jgi:polar amino acid transport system substrate-binding protein
VENTLLTRLGVQASGITPGATPEEVLALLEDGEIDLWATGDLAGRHQMTTTAVDPNLYEIVYTLGENDFSFIFSRDVPEPLVTAFQYALDVVINQEDAGGISEYERIINRYSGIGSTNDAPDTRGG